MNKDLKQSEIVNPTFEISPSDVRGDEKDENITDLKNQFSPSNHENPKDSQIKDLHIFLLTFGLGWICISLAASVLLPLTNSVTSILSEDQLELVSLSIASGFLTIPFFLALMTKLFSVKRTILFAMVCILLFDVSFFYPVISILIPASVLMGIAMNIVFCNSFVFGNSLGLWYHKFAGGNLDNILFFISSLMSASLGSGFLWGNVIYYMILDTESSTTIERNASTMSMCGAAYCNEDLGNSTETTPLSVSKLRTMLGAYAGIVTLSFVIFIFVMDPSTKLKKTPAKIKDFFVILKGTYSLLKNPKAYLLIVITAFVGMEEHFLVAVYTRDFISCVLGVSKVGYIMFTFGISLLLAPFLQYPLMKFCGRPVVSVIFCLLFLGEFFTLLFIQPSTGSAVTFFIVTIVHGIADTMAIATVWSTYSVLFATDIESALSLGNVWYTVGVFIVAAISELFCCYVNLYILIGMVIIGTLLQLVLEYMIYRKKKT